MANPHRRDGDPRSTPPNSSTGNPPSQSYASKAAAREALIFLTTYSHPQYGHLAVPPKRNPQLDHSASAWSIAYLVPKTVTSGEVHDAAADTFEQNSDNPVMGVDRFPTSTAGHHRVEVSYDPQLDPAIISTIPITVHGVEYHLVSTQTDYIITRFAISDYRFRPADVQFQDLFRLTRSLADDFGMGDVIKIEVPKFRSPKGRYAYRSECVFYTKGEREATSSVPRSIPLEGHQTNPIKVGWNGAPPLCTYCKREGHLLRTCAERLSKICNNCHAPGHISVHCARYGERDRKAAGKSPVSASPSTSYSNAASSSTASSTMNPSSPTIATTTTPAKKARARSPSHFELSDGELAHLNDYDYDYESDGSEDREGMSDVQSEVDSAPEQTTQPQDMDVDNAAPTATTVETYKDQPPYTQIPFTKTPLTLTPQTQMKTTPRPLLHPHLHPHLRRQREAPPRRAAKIPRPLNPQNLDDHRAI
ncbi:hypothetical protein BGZ67_010648 [Mortierella alpina]|nr:hypothetical protein BGZ67_010648 [Mortierella alpina]